MRIAVSAFAVILCLGSAACGGKGKSDGGPQSLTRIVLEPTSSSTERKLDVSIELFNARLDKLGVKKASVARESNRIVVILPTDHVRESLRLLLLRGRLEFFDLQGDLTERSLDAQRYPVALRRPPRAGPKTVVVTCGPNAYYCPGVADAPDRAYYYLFNYDPGNDKHSVPELTGDDLEFKGTRQDFDTASSQPVVLIQFTKAGAKKFHDITRRLAARGRVLHNQIGGEPEVAFQQFAIVLDRKMYSAPTIDYNENPAGIPGRNGAQITGLGSLQDAKDLALVLQTGALPLAFRVVSRQDAPKP
ncbi:MAG: SecD/SecF fusion protein [Gaiellaceae bacterium]|jgi:preprotein translocase subunit SecD|nr:SecD/SecF fusion protein [Gaiellaceae bacterium]